MKVNRQELLSVLDAMLPGLAGGRSVVQNGDRFVFHDCRIYTFNDEIGVSHPTTLDFDGAVAAEELYQLLKRHRAKEVSVEVNGPDLVVATANSKAGITMDESTSAFHEEIKFPSAWSPLPGDFIASLTLASTTAGKNLSDLILTFVRVVGNTCWATNNIEIICVTMDGEVPGAGFMVPANIAKVLAGYEPVEYGLQKGWLHFRNQHNVTFSVRTVEAEYPNLEEYFVECGGEVKITGETAEALDRLNVFAKENTGGMVDVAAIKGGIRLSAKADAGWIKERVRAECPQGAMFRIHVDVLRKALEKSATFGLSEISIVIAADGFRYTACLVQEGAQEALDVPQAANTGTGPGQAPNESQDGEDE